MVSALHRIAIVRNFIPRFLLLLCATTGVARAQLSISEFLASNSTSLADESGNHEDWIEIHNVSGGAVNLAGWYLSDDASEPRRWAFPNWTLNAGGYLVVFASEKNRRPPQAVAGQDNLGTSGAPRLHTNFKLSADGEYLSLSKDAGDGALEIKQAFNPYPPQATDVAYGSRTTTSSTSIVTAGVPLKYFVPTAANGGSTLAYSAWTGGAEPFAAAGWSDGAAPIGFNGAGVSPAALKLRLNANAADELAADTSGAGHAATLLGVAYNAGDTDATGKTRHGTMAFGASDSNGAQTGDLATIPGSADFDGSTGTICFWIRTAGLAGGGGTLGIVYDRRAGVGVGIGTVIYQSVDGKLNFQAGNGSGSATVQFATATSIADDRWHHVAVVYAQASGGTCSFYVDGALSAQAIATAAWSWTSTQPIELGRSHDPSWKAFNGQLDDFRHYNAQLSAAQLNLIGANADEPIAAATSVASAMLGNPGNPDLFLRIPFQIDNPAAFDAVRLNLQWSDGYIAWLNGVQVSSFASPVSPVYNSTATQTHSFGAPYGVSFGASALRTGANLLAIQAMNNLGTNSYFGISPQVSGVKVVLDSAGYLLMPTPGADNSQALTTLGPFVSQVTKNPVQPTGNAASPPLTITADILPALHPLRATGPVQLKYRVMFGAEQSVDMTDAGAVAGAPSGTRRYQAAIATSALGAGQMLRWRVVATDNAGATTTAPTYTNPADGDQYYGTVAQDALIESSLPVIYWFTNDPGSAATSTGTRNAFFFRPFHDTGPGRFYDNVAINIHGQSSQTFPKKSYNLDFNKDNRFVWDTAQSAVKDVKLLTNWGDKSKTHNVMAHEAFAAAGSVAHWGRQVRVQQVTAGNAASPGTQFYGIYDLLEDGDEDFLARNGRDPAGALYKIYDNLVLPDNAEKKTRKTEAKSDYQELVNSLDPSRSLADRRLYAYDNMDLPQCISYFVGCIITSHQDHGHKNFYVYRDSPGTGEWAIFPWDVDLTWGRTYLDNPGYFSDTIYVDNELDQYKQSMQGKTENRLYNLFVGNNDFVRTPAPEFRDMVLRRLRTVMDSYLNVPNLLENRFTDLANLLDPPTIGTSDADRDFSTWGTWQFAGGATGGAATRYHISEINGPGRYLAGRRAFLNTASLAGALVPNSQTAAAESAVTIETIDFKPAITQQAEYFVLRNTGAVPVDLSNWKITGAVELTFRPGTVLPPGGGVTENLGDLYVAKDPVTFRNRVTVSDDGQPARGRYRLVQGPYSGQLSARGESIELRNAAGTLLRNKSWQPAPTPAQAQLRLTELNYAPTNPTPAESASLPGVVANDFEFIELRNIGAAALELDGCAFTNGVAFTFPARTLSAGERVLVVANLAAFQLRYGHAADTKIAGVFNGNLDNSGENLQLTDQIGETILDFNYSNVWFPPSNKGGRSLVMKSDQPAYDAADLPQSWLLSGAANGTPGEAETSFATVYDGWRWSYFLPAEIPTTEDPARPAAPMLDPDGDGLCNLLEYAFGRDPKVPQAAAAITPGLNFAGSAEYLTVTFVRPRQALDLQYFVEGSTSLVNPDWQPLIVAAAAVDLGDGFERVTFQDSLPHAAQAHRFLRVRVVQP